ncbi:hypothetical protein M441DRAFT_454684 [Trichoderma asperellum CBS 433.97]|uniref:Uncharacterized protein n=1 Tax=Trichoderma asperellum (strain ATCC 204424 / CBS 433.97 / NBRC 101777) TaxID=1042311 RepID=A0A2T3ZDB0_TRIA4|nr:hypothetical protein M441DRAFT_454684 [Trichoderma asperellum CBS 433.97]PTB42774.1 hypothetical protein M441DRAFT_454684 [Trichoderma asperellum CBS 433.97]
MGSARQYLALDRHIAHYTVNLLVLYNTAAILRVIVLPNVLPNCYVDIDLQMLAWIQFDYKDPPMRKSGWPDSTSFDYPILVSSLTEWIQPGEAAANSQQQCLHNEKE